jgi:hypothetical protein
MILVRHAPAVFVLVLACGVLHGQVMPPPCPTPSGSQPESKAMDVLACELGYDYPIRQIVPAVQGVREFGSGPSYGQMPYLGSPAILNPDGTVRRPGITHEDAIVRNCYCDASSVVVASFVGSRTGITTAKSMIYTVNKFTVAQTIKSSDGLTPGSDIYVITLGGTVLDGGETLKQDEYDAVPFEPTSQYLFLLAPLKGAPSNFFEIVDDQVTALRDGNLHPLNKPAAKAFADGEQLASAIKRRENLVQGIPCETAH